MKHRRIFLASFFSMILGIVLLPNFFVGSAQIGGGVNTGQTGQALVPVPNLKKQLIPANLPREVDVRGPHGRMRAEHLRLMPRVQSIGGTDRADIVFREGLACPDAARDEQRPPE